MMACEPISGPLGPAGLILSSVWHGRFARATSSANSFGKGCLANSPTNRTRRSIMIWSFRPLRPSGILWLWRRWVIFSACSAQTFSAPSAMKSSYRTERRGFWGGHEEEAPRGCWRKRLRLPASREAIGKETLAGIVPPFVSFSMFNESQAGLRQRSI